MAETLRLAESRVAIAQDAQQQAEEEVAFLKRGIDLAAEQLTKSAGAEVPSTLLVALAKVGTPPWGECCMQGGGEGCLVVLPVL